MAAQRIHPTTNRVSSALSSISLAPMNDALKAIFATPAQETLMQKTRHIMGDTVSELADDELESYITKFQHLIDYWLDTFEQQNFDGMTLQQILREG
jgi:vacuolar-type H+-ATPase subunit D/Vma8